MRKRFTIVLMCALILGLVGCGQLPKLLTFSVSGEVTDADGNGIAGVIVGFSGGFGTAVTDSNGKWSKDGLSGNVTVTPVKEGWTFDPIKKEVSTSQSDVNFTGTPIRYAVSGIVLDADGNGLEGVTISFSEDFGTVTTDVDGNWSKEGLFGTVTVTPTNVDWVFDPESIEVTEARDGIDFIGTIEIIIFADSDLENLVREAIDKLQGDIYPSDVADLTVLEACGGDLGITLEDLSGLEYLVNLTELKLGSCGITDISPIAELTKLVSIKLSNNDISDLTALANLTNLEIFVAGENSISDITPLAGLTNLVMIKLGYNEEISDLTPLAQLTNLTELRLGYNNISDITPLAGLTNLTDLGLGYNQISNIISLANLTNLNDLCLGENAVSDITPLAGLTNLTYLGLELNQISDISSLVANEGLADGDYVNLFANSLDLTLDSEDMQNINALIDRGVCVNYLK